MTMSLLTSQHSRTTGVLLAGILTSLYSSESVGPGDGALRVRLVWVLSSRLDAAVRGKCVAARPVGTRPEFVEDKLRCNCLCLGG